MTTPVARVYVPESDERYDTAAACQLRCDELNGQIEATRDQKIQSQIIIGAIEKNMLDSWDDVRFVTDVSVGGDYWRPRMVPGNR